MRCGSWRRFRSPNRPMRREKPDEAVRRGATIEDQPRIPDHGWIRRCHGLAHAPRFRRRLLQRPGGGADLIARLLSPHLQHSLGQPFVVENRAGAAGRIGTAVVAKSDPDGHVLLMTTESSLVIAPHIGVPLNYEPLKDFAPISLLTRNTVIL